MTNEDLKRVVQKKYQPGDIIILKTWDINGRLREKTKATIIEFYSSYVLVEVNGFRECYKYWDVLQMTNEPRKSEPLGRHPRGSYKNKYA